jgi:hypothetical protein
MKKLLRLFSGLCFFSIAYGDQGMPKFGKDTPPVLLKAFVEGLQKMAKKDENAGLTDETGKGNMGSTSQPKPACGTEPCSCDTDLTGSVSLTQDSPISVTSVPTSIEFKVIVGDNGWIGLPLMCPTTGYYTITYNIPISMSISSARAEITTQLYRNGVPTTDIELWLYTSNLLHVKDGDILERSVILPLTIGDELNLKISAITSLDADIVAGDSLLTIIKIS